MKTAGLGLAAAMAYLLAAATAGAAPFGPPTTIGWGSQPALGLVAGAALAPDGAVAVAGTAATNNRRQAVAVFASADAAPAAARGFDPSSGAFDVGFAANASGDAAPTFTVGHTAYLTTCRDGRCRPTIRVGGSALKPQSAVAVQPGRGRAIVLWRGRASRGVNRLQWRVTTNGRLGATHTLGEFGDSPQLATDASGTTVAAWLGDRRSGRRGVRTAARRIGEFGAPATVTSTPAGALRLITSDAGSAVAAWLTGPNRTNSEQTAGTVQVATRTRATRFGASQSLGTGSTLSLAGSPGGQSATLPQPIGAAISPTQALVAWVGPQGAQIARAPAGFARPAVDLFGLRNRQDDEATARQRSERSSS